VTTSRNDELHHYGVLQPWHHIMLLLLLLLLLLLTCCEACQAGGCSGAVQLHWGMDCCHHLLAATLNKLCCCHHSLLSLLFSCLYVLLPLHQRYLILLMLFIIAAAAAAGAAASFHCCCCCCCPCLAALTRLVPVLQGRLRAAVETEQQHEVALIRQLYSSGNIRRLQKDGLVLTGLQAVPHSVLYSSMVWKFSMKRVSRDLPYHRFRQGDSLLITRWSEGGQPVGVSGRGKE
jgi:hypothetical protein